MEFLNLDMSQKEKISELNDTLEKLGKSTDSVEVNIKELSDRIKNLARDLNVKTNLDEQSEGDDNIRKFNKWLDDEIPYKWNGGCEGYDLNQTDIMAATIIGGIAVVLDFLVVKLPKETKIDVSNDGSPLTAVLRSIGSEEDGKHSKWVKWLEGKCKVPYDASVDSSIKGFSPKTHRLRSLGHDSLLGVLFAIFDINNGTMSVIDKDGNLIIKKTAEKASEFEIIRPIVKYFGHLLSDITTKMGIPIPGWCLLKTFNVGSFGIKERTISEVAEYMYLTGYDMRHLATMSTVNLVIYLLCKLYFAFLGNIKNDSNLVSQKEYVEIKNNIKLHRIRAIAYSIATVGNIAKLFVCKNPNALNLPLLIGFIKETIIQVKILARDTKEFEEIIEGRMVIDNNWEYLSAMLKRMECIQE